MIDNALLQNVTVEKISDDTVSIKLSENSCVYRAIRLPS